MDIGDSHDVDAARLQLAIVELTKLLPIEIPLPQIIICARDLLFQVNILRLDQDEDKKKLMLN
jgi:hypothetical protein